VYENEPSELSVNDAACEGPETSCAVIALPSGSESFPRTPGAPMVRVVSSFVEYESLLATGAGYAARLPPRAVCFGQLGGEVPLKYIVPLESTQK